VIILIIKLLFILFINIFAQILGNPSLTNTQFEILSKGISPSFTLISQDIDGITVQFKKENLEIKDLDFLISVVLPPEKEYFRITISTQTMKKYVSVSYIGNQMKSCVNDDIKIDPCQSLDKENDFICTMLEIGDINHCFMYERAEQDGINEFRILDEQVLKMKGHFNFDISPPMINKKSGEFFNHIHLDTTEKEFNLTNLNYIYSIVPKKEKRYIFDITLDSQGREVHYLNIIFNPINLETQIISEEDMLQNYTFFK
jgi:hypothetical protein